MMNLEAWQTFLAWNLIVHVVVMAFTFVVFYFGRHKLVGFHQQMFGLSKDQMLRTYLNFIALYKVLVMVFVLTPYVVIRFIL